MLCHAADYAAHAADADGHADICFSPCRFAAAHSMPRHTPCHDAAACTLIFRRYVCRRHMPFIDTALLLSLRLRFACRVADGLFCFATPAFTTAFYATLMMLPFIYFHAPPPSRLLFIAAFCHLLFFSLIICHLAARLFIFFADADFSPLLMPLFAHIDAACRSFATPPVKVAGVRRPADYAALRHVMLPALVIARRCCLMLAAMRFIFHAGALPCFRCHADAARF